MVRRARLEVNGGPPNQDAPIIYTHPNYTPVVAGLRDFRDRPESIDPPRFYYIAGLDRWRQLNFTKFDLWNEPKGLGADPAAKANPPGATGLELAGTDVATGRSFFMGRARRVEGSAWQHCLRMSRR